MLRRRSVDEVPVSEFCEANDRQPSLFHDGQRQLFENAANDLQAPAPVALSK